MSYSVDLQAASPSLARRHPCQRRPHRPKSVGHEHRTFHVQRASRRTSDVGVLPEVDYRHDAKTTLTEGGRNLWGRAMAFKIDAGFTRPLAVLKFYGELDLSTAEHIDWGIAQAFDNDCNLIALDLAEVSFIDCAAIGAFVAAKHRLDAASGRLRFLGVSPQVSRLLELTGMIAFFDLNDDPDTSAPST